MGLFGNIFENPAIQKAAFGQLAKLIKSEGLEMIIVKLDPETDEIVVDMYKPGEVSLAVTTLENPEKTAENAVN